MRLPNWLQEQLNEAAIGLAHDNVDDGLVNASVWCYTPTDFNTDTDGDGQADSMPIVTAVNSVDLLKYGSCGNVLRFGHGATDCRDIGGGWFCVIAKEELPATPGVLNG
jgi:hypothetical protein